MCVCVCAQESGLLLRMVVENPVSQLCGNSYTLSSAGGGEVGGEGGRKKGEKLEWNGEKTGGFPVD